MLVSGVLGSRVGGFIVMVGHFSGLTVSLAMANDRPLHKHF